MEKVFLPLFFLLLFSGCYQPPAPYEPTPEEWANADYGLFPTNYEQKIKSYMEISLKDPMSALYNFWGPSKVCLKSPDGKIEYGWQVVVWVRAKNSYGAYEGEQPFFCFFKNETFYVNPGGSFSYPPGSKKGTIIPNRL